MKEIQKKFVANKKRLENLRRRNQKKIESGLRNLGVDFEILDEMERDEQIRRSEIWDRNLHFEHDNGIHLNGASELKKWLSEAFFVGNDLLPVFSILDYPQSPLFRLKVDARFDETVRVAEYFDGIRLFDTDSGKSVSVEVLSDDAYSVDLCLWSLSLLEDDKP